jgi:hypothetical protein
MNPDLVRTRSHGDTGRLAWLVGMLVVLLACWNVRTVVGFDFVAWDDDFNIYLNPHLGPPGAKSMAWMFEDFAYMRRYVPLGWLAFSSVYAFSGLDPAGYHAAGVLLHGVNTALVFALLLMLLARFGPAKTNGASVMWAGLGALLWAVHPFRAETVGWASGLLYAVATAFALASVLAFLRSRAICDVGRRRWWLLVASVLFACSLLAYPLTLGVVVVFGLIDVAEWRARWQRGAEPWWRDRRLRLAAAENIALLLPAVAALAMTLVARWSPSTFWVPAPTWSEFGPFERARLAFDVWAYYLWKPFWPVNLSPAPSWLFEAHGAVSVASIIALVAISLWAWRQRTRGWGPLLLWLGYLAILFPLLGLTERQHYTSDRYHYVVGVLAVAALVLSLARLSRRWRGVAATFVGAAVIACAVAQQRQLEVWRNTDTLRRRIAETTRPAELRAENYARWAMFKIGVGRKNEAATLLADAERAGALNRKGRELAAEIAAPSIERAPVRLIPAVALAHGDYARDFARDGRVREANEQFHAALALAPDFFPAKYEWAVLRAQHGDAAGALHLLLSIETNDTAGIVPADARARLLSLIGHAFSADGRIRAACAAVERALALAGKDDPGADAAGFRAQLAEYRAALGR